MFERIKKTLKIFPALLLYKVNKQYRCEANSVLKELLKYPEGADERNRLEKKWDKLRTNIEATQTSELYADNVFTFGRFKVYAEEGVNPI